MVFLVFFFFFFFLTNTFLFSFQRSKTELIIISSNTYQSCVNGHNSDRLKWSYPSCERKLMLLNEHILTIDFPYLKKGEVCVWGGRGVCNSHAWYVFANLDIFLQFVCDYLMFRQRRKPILHWLHLVCSCPLVVCMHWLHVAYSARDCELFPWPFSMFLFTLFGK